jgi:UDP-N-acetyl-alpha-D-muramoyl-L-alanyl-L-glutamate epimerase
MVSAKINKKLIELRKEFKYFSFEDYTYSLKKEHYLISFSFSLDGKYSFHPEIKIPHRAFYQLKDIPIGLIENLVFHMGMVELISYWKAACPQRVIIKPFKLSKAQVLWWKKLYFNGLGEFFYLNGITTDQESFMQIESGSDALPPLFDIPVQDHYMVPVGGGKDSVVTLELLKSISQVIPMVINPRKATDECIEAAGFDTDETIIVHRTIDPQLLELNEKGFLNGHTPFSAMLAFTSLLMATITGIKNIALSNEASANEATVAGTNINHQYSKSYEFENDFRNYVNRYITKSINYFSFLRPLHEIQIAKLFSGFDKYFPVFKSCNIGSKTDIWCCNCSKCLFAYIILAPWLNQEELIRIFGDDLLNKSSLQFEFDQLTGRQEIKPFECIGTMEEVNIALCVAIKKYNNEIPELLKGYMQTPEFKRYKDIDPADFIARFETNHFLNSDEMEIIKNRLHE